MKKKLLVLCLTLSCVFASAFAFSAIKPYSATAQTQSERYMRRFDTYEIENYVDGVTVTDPVGNPAEVTDGKMVLMQTGDYIIAYPDKSERVIHVYSYIPESEFVLEKGFNEEYATGEYLYIPAARISSEIKVYAEYFVLVENQGETVLLKDGYDGKTKIILEKLGVYEVTYGYLDVFGYITTKTYTFTVVDKPVLILPDITVLHLGKTYDLTAYGYDKGNTTPAQCVVTDPNGETVGAENFTPKIVGTYTLEFSVNIGGEAIEKTAELDCVMISDNLFTGDDFEERQTGNFPLFGYSGEKGTGVELVGIASGAEFEYNRVIDAANLVKNKNLITFQAISADGYGTLNAVEIIVSDAYDESNNFSVFFWQCPNVVNYTYVGVGYMGVYAGVGNEWYDGKDHTYELRYSPYGPTDKYCFGAILHNHSLTGKESKNIMNYKIQFDYSDGKVYVTDKDGQYMLRDLGYAGHVGGKENIFKGFTHGKAKITVRLHDMLTQGGGVIVNEMAGQSLGGATITDGQAPDMSLELSGENMNSLPRGVVGVGYRLPEVYATDNITEIVKNEIKVYYGEKEKRGLIADGVFTPDKSGAYKVIYSAFDAFGNQTQKQIEIIVDEEKTPITVDIEERDSALIGNYYLLPEASVSGGSGTLTVKTKFVYAGEEVFPDESGKIYIEEYGLLQVTVEVTDFLGDTKTQTKSFTLYSSEPLISHGLIPLMIAENDELTIPEFSVKQYASGEWSDCEVKAYIDGAEYTAKTYKPKADAKSFVLKYEANAADGLVSKEFVIAVNSENALSDFFIKSDDTAVVTDDSGTRFSLANGQSVAYGYPIGTDNLVLRFAVKASSSASVNLIMKDCVDERKTVVLNFTYGTGTTSILKVNGKGAGYTVDGSFAGNAFHFIYDRKTNSLLNSLGETVCSFTASENGDPFGGFTSGTVYSSASASGANADFTFVQLSNQGFLTYSYRSGDTQAPIIVIDGDDAFLRTAEYGKKFEVFAATATDALTLGATCRVSVTSPSGKIIASGISASEPFTVDGDEYGFYSIVYAASDKYGNSSQKTVTVRIKDTVAPVINATVKLPSTVKVGKTVTLPKFTATDNLDKSPFIALFVVDAHGRYHTVEQGAKYAFTEKGKYKIVLYARDEAMNTARQEYTITAE